MTNTLQEAFDRDSARALAAAQKENNDEQTLHLLGAMRQQFGCMPSWAADYSDDFDDVTTVEPNVFETIDVGTEEK